MPTPVLTENSNPDIVVMLSLPKTSFGMTECDSCAKPRRCHRMTVSGLTTVIAFRIEGKNRYSQTKISRSMFRSRARDRDLRLKTITC
jgi:hypothetical protein